MRRRESVTSVCTFLLIGTFALMCLLLITLGGRVYAAVNETARQNTQMRTSLCYIASKVRGHDAADAVRVLDTDGGQALELIKSYEKDVYITYIYCQDGGLYEFFAPAARDFDPALGERIADAQALSLSLSQAGLLDVTVMQDGCAHTLHLQLMGGVSR